jgi:hypothetical protein
VQLQPSWTFGYLFEFITDWVQDVKFGRSTPRGEWETLFKTDAQAPLHQVPWILDHYAGLLYPERETYTVGGDPRAIEQRIGMLLRLDPRLGGFLYLHAHLEAMQGRHDEVDRDLEVVGIIVEGSFGNVLRRMPIWDWIYRAWINADRPDVAFPYLQKLLDEPLAAVKKPSTYHLGTQVGKVRTWLNLTQSMAPLKADPRWEPFFKRFVRTS